MSEKEFTLFDLVKVAIFMAGAIYIVHLLSWLMHWGVIAAGMIGVGYLAYRIAGAGSEDMKLLEGDSHERRWLELEDEERRLDREIGIR